MVYGDVGSAEPSAVRADGRARIFVQANIHAGEVAGKEAAQVLGHLAGGMEAWLAVGGETSSYATASWQELRRPGDERVLDVRQPFQRLDQGGTGPTGPRILRTGDEAGSLAGGQVNQHLAARIPNSLDHFPEQGRIAGT